MEIIIDLDSTIINTSKTLLNIYNYENRSNLEFNPNHKWDFDGLFPNEYNSRAFQLFTEKIFYDFVEVIPNAIEVINRLAKNNSITIATKHHPLRIPNTNNFINKFFKNVGIKYLNSFDKSELNGDVFIDDRIDCLDSVKNNFKYILCFGNYDWNKDWNGIRFYDWLEIEKFICSM